MLIWDTPKEVNFEQWHIEMQDLMHFLKKVNRFLIQDSFYQHKATSRIQHELQFYWFCSLWKEDLAFSVHHKQKQFLVIVFHLLSSWKAKSRNNVLYIAGEGIKTLMFDNMSYLLNLELFLWTSYHYCCTLF